MMQHPHEDWGKPFYPVVDIESFKVEKKGE
jgi:hypothetical protein